MPADDDSTPATASSPPPPASSPKAVARPCRRGPSGARPGCRRRPSTGSSGTSRDSSTRWPQGFGAYLATKTELAPTADPVADLRAYWDLHIDFGLTNPALYLLMYAEPRHGATPPKAAVAGAEILAGHIHRIAEAGLPPGE